MSKMLETKKFVFTVEGETEQWYLEWLKTLDRVPSTPTKVIMLVYVFAGKITSLYQHKRLLIPCSTPGVLTNQGKSIEGINTP